MILPLTKESCIINTLTSTASHYLRQRTLSSYHGRLTPCSLVIQIMFSGQWLISCFGEDHRGLGIQPIVLWFGFAVGCVLLVLARIASETAIYLDSCIAGRLYAVTLAMIPDGNPLFRQVNPRDTKLASTLKRSKKYGVCEGRAGNLTNFSTATSDKTNSVTVRLGIYT